MPFGARPQFRGDFDARRSNLLRSRRLVIVAANALAYSICPLEIADAATRRLLRSTGLIEDSTKVHGVGNSYGNAGA
jgi:hypothetical protein